MKILIYSFDKFQNLKSNPAYEVAEDIVKRFNSEDVVLVKLPVTYGCWDILRNKIDSFKPDFILGIGVAVGINRVRVEKIGINYKHANISDSEGKKEVVQKIDSSGDLAYETEVDVVSSVESLKNKGIPCDVSLISKGIFELLNKDV